MASDRWSVELLDNIVVAELLALPRDMQDALNRLIKRIEIDGLIALRAPHVKSLGDKLWELRFSGRDGIARAMYVTASGKRVVIVHLFLKKSQKTPATAIALARSRAATVR